MREGDISLFKNDKKTPGSNQPDMRGKAMINGQVFKISAWSKGTGDSKFLSGKIELDTYVPAQSAPTNQAPVNPGQGEVIPGVDAEQDDLPF